MRTSPVLRPINGKPNSPGQLLGGCRETSDVEWPFLVAGCVVVAMMALNKVRGWSSSLHLPFLPMAPGSADSGWKGAHVWKQ